MKTGIIGAGIISESHLRAFAHVEGMDAVCIADINRNKAEELAEKYRLKAYTDYKEMIVKESLGAVIIALPHYLHHDAGIFCMENGCHILMEKPMAISTHACDRLIETAEKYMRTFLVGHICYYFEEDRLIVDILRSGRLGGISMINIKRYCNYFCIDRPSWFLNPSMSGGGILANVGAHEIEKVIRYGGDIKEIKAFAVKGEDVDVEGIINAVFELNNGISASIKLNGYSARMLNELEIICSRGIIRKNLGRSYLEILTGEGEEKIDLLAGYDPFVLQLKDFQKCIKTGSKPYLSGEYGRKVIDAIERTYLSAGIKYF